MKNYGGLIHFSENLDWYAGDQVVRGGGRPNPFRQVKAYKWQLRNLLVEHEHCILREPRNVNWNRIHAIVVFGRQATFDEPLPEPIAKWFHIRDVEAAPARLKDLDSDLNLYPDETDAIVAKVFGLNSSYRYRGLTPPKTFPPRRNTRPNRKMKVIFDKGGPFREQQYRLRISGGARSQGVSQAIQLLDDFRNGIDRLDEFTTREDPRIENAVIVRFNDYCELIVLRFDTLLYPYFIGEPPDVEKWVAANAGLTVSVEGETKRVCTTFVGTEVDTASLDSQDSTITNKPFLERVDGLDLEELVPQRLVRRHLGRLDEESDETEIMEALEAVPNEDVRSYLFDIIRLIRAGEIEAAKARIQLRNGDACHAGDAATLSEEAFSDIVNADQMVLVNDFAQQEFGMVLEARQLVKQAKMHCQRIFINDSSAASSIGSSWPSQSLGTRAV